MKKRFVIIVSIFVMLAVLASCNSTKTALYESFIADVANDGIGISAESDYWAEGNFNMASKSGETKTISYNGVQYTGKYMHSYVDKLDSYTTDYYVDENYIEFGINSDTGKLVLLNLMNNTFFDTEPYLDEVADPEYTAIAVAEQVAKNFLAEITDYERIIETPQVRYKERDGQRYRISYHVITFAKKINGFYTSDYISIKVTSKGNLASIKVGDLNAFSGASIEIDPNRLQDSVSQKVDAVYKTTSYSVVDASNKDQKLVKTPDGRICVYSAVGLRLKAASTETFDSGIAIITVVG